MKRVIATILTLLIAVCALRFGTVISHADNADYGTEAYSLLRAINDGYPYRTSDVRKDPDLSKKAGMLQWIDGKMASYGYGSYKTFTFPLGPNGEQTCVSHTFVKKGNSAKRVLIGAHYDCAGTKGCEDNGTGVAVCLEVAKRFANTPTNLTLEFCFWDAEEYWGFPGGLSYLQQCPDKENILLYVNLDSVGSGDNLYVYGGEYINGALKRAWGYNMARETASDLGVDLREMPMGVTLYPAPTRTGASDQAKFAEAGIPYVYFEANAWVDANGKEVMPETPYRYNTKHPAFAETNGQIIHTKFDDMDYIEANLPGVLKKHLTETALILSEMLRRMHEGTPAAYEQKYTGLISVNGQWLEYKAGKLLSEKEEPTTEAPTTTEAVTETEAITTETESVTETLESDDASVSESESLSTEEPVEKMDESTKTGLSGTTVFWILEGGLAALMIAGVIFLVLTRKKR